MPLIPDATGRLVELLPPDTPDDDRDQLLMLVRKGCAFSKPTGRPVGVLARHITATVESVKPGCFHALLVELRLQAQQNRLGLGDAIILEVNRTDQKLIYNENGRKKKVTFKRLKNIASINK